MSIKVPRGSERTGTPKNIFPPDRYLFEIQEVTSKEIVDDNEGYVKGTNVSIRTTVEDVLKPANEGRIGSTYFHNIFIMSEEHPSYDNPLQNDPDRTVGDLGADQFVDFQIACGLDPEDEVEEDSFVGLRVWGQVSVYKDKKNNNEETNRINRWYPEVGDSEDEEEEEAPAPKKKAAPKKKKTAASE